MRSGERGVNLHLVPSSRHTNSDEKPVLTKKTSYIPRHERDCLEKGGACSWPSHTAIITKTLPEVAKGLSPDSSLTELTSTTDMARYEKIGDPRTARGNSDTLLGRSFQNCSMKNFCISERLKGHSRDAVQPHFFTDTVLEKGYAKELNHIGSANYDDALATGDCWIEQVMRRNCMRQQQS